MSSTGLMDQTINLYETKANSGNEATEMLKNKLDGGLQIRIRKVDDLSPVLQPSLELKIKEKFKNKSRMHVLILTFGGILMLLAMVAKLLRYL